MKTKRLSMNVVMGAIAGVAIIVAIIYLAYLSQSQFEETVVSQAQQQLLTTATSAAKAIEEFIEEHSDSLKVLSNDPFIKEQLHNKVQWKEEEGEEFCRAGNLYEINKDEVDALYLIDVDGVILDRDPFKKRRIGSSLADRPGVAYVLKEHKPCVSGLFFSGSGDASISILQPVFYNNEFTGIVGYLIHADDTIYANFVKPIKAGKKGYAWLFDNRNIILSHPRKDYLGMSVLDVIRNMHNKRGEAFDESRLKEHIREDHDYLNRVKTEEEESGIFLNCATDENDIVVYKRISRGNLLWNLVVTLPYSEIEGPIHEHERDTFGLAGLVILILGAGGVLLFRTQKRKAQLETEAKYLKEIANGAEALRESEEKYRSLFQSSIDGILFTDMEGHIIDVNKVYLDMLGYSEEEVKKLSYQQLTPSKWHETEANTVKDQIIARGYSDEYEKEYIKKDGTIFPISIRVWLLKDEKGKSSGMWGIVRDISERKRAEEERKELEAKLQQAQKMEAIGVLAGGIAHNFNNLLMAIQGNASLMLFDIDSTHPHYEFLTSIKNEVKDGAELARQLLGYARKGQYYVQPMNLNELVEQASESVGKARKEISIHRELSENLFAIEADQSQIQQVLLNLLVNAADAMPGGGDLILKTANATDTDMEGKAYDVKPGNYVQLTVTDTGKGMDKETQERIFEPFFTTKEMGRGTGLGLASVYGIIKGHAGYIDVESEKGRGTTFTIYLPATEKKVEEAVQPAEQIVKGTGTILLVDDEDRVMDVGTKLLEKLGYTVLEAVGGREAVEIYKENKDKIDLVLLDMVMPRMGGGEAYDKMKEINPDVKVLLSSGYDIDSEAKSILARGCDAFIQKPYSMKELSVRIREILDKK